MSDTTIPLTSAGSGVWQYKVPQTGEIVIRSVRAVFDGSGIGSAWFPAVRIIAPSGVTDGDYVTAASVAAGGSADVSSFPGAEEASGGAAGSLDIEHNAASVGTEPALDFEDSGSLAWTVTDVAGARVTVSGTVAGATDQPFAIAYRNGFSIPSAAGGSSANFDPWTKLDSTGADIDLDGSSRIRFNTTGLYRINFALQISDSTWAGTDTLDLNFLLLTGAGANAASSTWPGKTTFVGPNNPSGTPKFWELAAEVWLNLDTVPETVRMQALSVTGGSTHTATSTFAVASMLRVGPHSAGGVN